VGLAGGADKRVLHGRRGRPVATRSRMSQPRLRGPRDPYKGSSAVHLGKRFAMPKDSNRRLSLQQAKACITCMEGQYTPLWRAMPDVLRAEETDDRGNRNGGGIRGNEPALSQKSMIRKTMP